MRRYDPRLIIGVLLVLGGLLSLLDAMGVVSDGGDIFWGLVFAAGGLIFLYMLINNRENWWAAFPAFTLLGLAASSFLPNALEGYSGLVFFAGLSLGFWWVYSPGRIAGGRLSPRVCCLRWVSFRLSTMSLPASNQADSSSWDSG